jgi:hypothetical protein
MNTNLFEITSVVNHIKKTLRRLRIYVAPVQPHLQRMLGNMYRPKIYGEYLYLVFTTPIVVVDIFKVSAI